MSMFNHILVPVDGSNPSLLAARKAAELSKVFGSAVTAVYVVDPYPFTGVGADFAYGQSQYLSAATAEANTTLDAVKKITDEAGITATTVVGSRIPTRSLSSRWVIPSSRHSWRRNRHCPAETLCVSVPRSSSRENERNTIRAR